MERHEQSEKDIDAVLQSFATAAPPDGMQQRVLERARTAPPQSTQPWYSSMLSVAAATACILVAATAWVVKQNNHPVILPVERTPTVASYNEPLAPVRSRSMRALPHTLPNASSKPHLTWASTTGHSSAVLEGRAVAHSQSPTDDDAMNAPSRQAPPLPLTPQERLLVGVARGHALQPQIASLRRPVWPLRDPADDEDFRRFFDSQTPLAHDGDNE